MSSLKHTDEAPLAVIASEDGDYERLGLAREAVAPWEDGARTDNRRGTYEWWYFDSHLDDGSSRVVVFMNKDGRFVHRARHRTTRRSRPSADYAAIR
jgi:hypothetical protein